MVDISYIDSIPEEQLVLDRYTVPSIVEYIAKTNNDISYGELAESVKKRGKEKMDPRGFARTLGRIQHYCEAVNLPCLSAMVVSKSKNAAGEGFIECYLELHPELVGLPEHEIRAKERKEVFACNEWQKLYDYLGIEETAPEMRDMFYDWEAKTTYEEGRLLLKEAHLESERNPKARAECIRLKGKVCLLCERDSEKIYGIPGIIEIHHIKPLSAYNRNESHTVDPRRDLIPVCPTCHAAIHRKDPGKPGDCFTPNEIRKMLGKEPLPEYE